MEGAQFWECALGELWAGDLCAGDVLGRPGDVTVLAEAVLGGCLGYMGMVGVVYGILWGMWEEWVCSLNDEGILW